MKTFKTKQQIFDEVASHLLTQKKKAVNENEDCMYRTPEGLKCGIGGIIPDEVYKEWQELEFHAESPDGRIHFEPSFGIEGLMALCFPADLLADMGIEATSEMKQFLGALQGIHDSYKVQDWLSILASFATRNSLNTEVLNRF